MPSLSRAQPEEGHSADSPKSTVVRSSCSTPEVAAYGRRQRPCSGSLPHVRRRLVYLKTVKKIKHDELDHAYRIASLNAASLNVNGSVRRRNNASPNREPAERDVEVDSGKREDVVARRVGRRDGLEQG